MAITPGEGTVLKHAATAIAQVTEISGPKSKCNVIETTHLTSTAHTVRASLIADYDQMTFKCEFDPNNSGHRALQSLIDTPSEQTWSVVQNSTPPAIGTFQGWLVQIDYSGMSIDQNLMGDCVIKISGPVVWT